jgi:putative transposase
MSQSFACLNYHLIFSTKHREPTLKPEILARLYEYVGGYLRAEKGCLLAAGGMPDHVHWLVSLHKQMSVVDALRGIKSISSKWIHETYGELQGFAWQTGYGAFTVSHSQLTKVRKYLDDQNEHHRTTSFQEEYLAYLRRHGIVYDEKYIWD